MNQQQNMFPNNSQSNDLMSLISRNRKTLIGIALVLVLGLLGLWISQFLAAKKEQQALEAFFPIQTQARERAIAFAKSEPPPVQPGQPPAPAPAPAPVPGARKKSGDLQQDWGDLASQIKNFAETHGDTAAGAQATVLLSELYDEYKKLPELTELIGKIADQQNGREYTQGLLFMIQGNALAAKNDCAQAVKSWDKVIKSKKTEFISSEAALRSGVCYQVMSDRNNAEKMYKLAAATSSKESAVGAQANQFLRALDLAPIANDSATNAPAASSNQ